MNGAPPIPGINNASELETFIAAGHLKDPNTIAQARAAYGSAVMDLPPLESPAAPAPPPDVPIAAGLMPKAPPESAGPQPLAASPFLPAAPAPVAAPKFLWDAPSTTATPPKVAGNPAAQAPMAAPHPKPAAAIPMHAAAPPGPPPDYSKFGYTPHEIKQQDADVKHLEAQQATGNAINQIEAEKADEAQELIDRQLFLAARREEQAALQQKRRQNSLNRFEADSAMALDDYMKSEVNPNHYWESKNTASKISSLVSVALGGIGQVFMAKSGSDPGRNNALDMIQDAMRQDIDLQKASIAKKGAGLDARKGLYTQMLQRFGSEDAAEAMTLEAGMRRAQMDANAMAAKYDNKELKERLAAFNEEADFKIEQYKNGVAVGGEKMHDLYKQAEAKRAAAAAASMQAKHDKRDELVFKSQLAVAEERAKKIGGSHGVLEGNLKLPNGNIIPAGSAVVLDKNGEIDLSGTDAAQKGSKVTTIAGFNAKGQPVYGEGVAKSPDDAKKFQAAQTSYTTIKQDLATIKAQRTAHGGGQLLSGDDTVAAKAAAKRVHIQLKNLAQLGVLSESDLKLLEAQMPSDPLATKLVGVVGGDPIGTQISELEKSLDAQYSNAEATYLDNGAQTNTALPLTAPK
jgi:hypothetical protein